MSKYSAPLLSAQKQFKKKTKKKSPFPAVYNVQTDTGRFEVWHHHLDLDCSNHWMYFGFDGDK
jgi:hypothetical protein